MNIIRYSKGFKMQLVREVESGKGSAFAVQRKYNIKGSDTVLRWVRQYGTDAGKAEAPRPAAAPFFKPVPVPTADQAAEIARLRRECDRLRMERDILKKSISIFAGPLK